MSSLSTCISRTGAILALLLAAGMVHAGSLESLVMPGPVIEAHAEWEDECSACHAPFERTDQRSLCLGCHEDVARDVEASQGFHGKSPATSIASCTDCHTDHQGRDKDITGLLPESFDHSVTDFPLTGVHKDAACTSCHAPTEPYRATESTCIACHADSGIHKGQLGEACSECHSTAQWRAARFDHAEQTSFALHGAHESQPCSSCHLDNVYDTASSECNSCHALNDVHNGSHGEACESCHTTKTWQESSFDHGKKTDFMLRGSHKRLDCGSCHLDSMTLAQPPQTCIGCHATDDVHQSLRGSDCAGCHNQDRWTVKFDHAGASGFALQGAHSLLSCESCHQGSLEARLPTDCDGCHATDNPHGEALAGCQSCHDATSWLRDLTFNHEFTRFPLLGLHAVATCDQCHTGLEFSAAPATCADCHQSDDIHQSSMGMECNQCHTPSGWELWSFDHDRQTKFPLDGAHGDLVCDACHDKADAKALDLSTSCVACHASVDVHRGQFGSNCSRCHNTQSFGTDIKGF